MKTANFYNYLPQRFATDDVRANQVRRFIYAFKSGERKAVDYAIDIVSVTLSKWYGASCKIMCYVAFRLQPIPSISAVSNVLQPR